MVRQLIMAIFMPLLLQPTQPVLLQSTQPGVEERAIEEQVEQPTDEKAIEKQVEQLIDEKAIEKQIETALKQVDWGRVTFLGVLAGILVPLGFFALVGLIVWLLVRWSQARTRGRMEWQRLFLDKFSDKFSTGREFAEFLATSAGQRFLDKSWSQPLSSKERMLRSVRTGVVLSVLGLGFLGVSWVRHGLLVPGVLLLALGAGFLIAAKITHHLSKEWGLTQDKESGSENEPISQS